MNNRLVTTCIAILSTLPATGSGVNDIIKNTSPDRSHVIEAIRLLEKGKIVSHGHWSHGKVKLIQPTDLGIEIKDLLENLNLFATSLKQLRYGSYKMSQVDPRRMKIGESESEIIQNRQDGITFVKSMCKKDIFLALAHKYTLLYYKYKLNQVCRAILIRIFSTEFGNQLQKGEKYVDLYKNTDILHQWFLRPLSNAIAYDIQCAYTSDFHLSSCNFVGQHIKDIASALLRIAGISKFVLADSINLAENYELEEDDLEKYDREYGEYLYHLLRYKNYVPYGPYEELPNSKDLRLKDKEELIKIFKSLLPPSSS